MPFLPLIVLYALGSLVPLVFGVDSRGLGYFILVAVSALAAGFGDEATFRGVVLQTLLPRRTLRAVISSVLYGAAYLGNIAAGIDPVLVGVWALNMVGNGRRLFGRRRSDRYHLATGAHQCRYAVPFFFETGANSRPGIVTVVVELVVGALAAAYGIWLLRRHKYRYADHSAARTASFQQPQ